MEINKNLIKKSHIEIDQSNIGAEIYDVDEFNAGVLAQVDQQLSQKEVSEAASIQTQLKNIENDLNLAKSSLDKLESDMNRCLNDGDADSQFRRKVRILENQMEIKIKQIQSLEARKKSLCQRLDAYHRRQELGDILVRDTAETDLVSRGEITPFAAASIKRKRQVKSPLVAFKASTTKRKEEQVVDPEESIPRSKIPKLEVAQSQASVVGGKQKLKRDNLLQRFVDDAYFDNYKKRLIQYKALLEEEDASASLDDIPSPDGDLGDGMSVPGRIWSKLYTYQQTCVRWLWELHRHATGGIVGDEMGLGKTIQVISFLAALHHSDKLNKSGSRGLRAVLIVCPASVLEQWVSEFHQWYPILRVAILHASGSGYAQPNRLVHNIVQQPGVLVTTYSCMVMHRDLLLKHPWHYIILDEGHKIKNPDALITMTCKQFSTPHRLILSGTPMQNNLKELWSLFDFVCPTILGTLPDFQQQFAVPIVQGGYSTASVLDVETAYRCACALRDMISPYLIRRMKADVRLQLPDKREQVLFCRLTDYQRGIYQEYLDSKECKQILNGQMLTFPGLIKLRKICNHPDLATGALTRFDPELAQKDPIKASYGWFERSGKLLVVDSLLSHWHREGHKVLLFTQSRAMLRILERYCKRANYPYLKMDGATAVGLRQRLVKQFNSAPMEQCFLFLLTTRVGGLGINLTGANRVLLYDPDWNPSTDIQARERAWRIGQTRDVIIYRLLTSCTIEEKIYHRQIFKQFLCNRILKNPRQSRFFKANDLHELFTLKPETATGDTETGALFEGTGFEKRIAATPVALGSSNRFDKLFETMKDGNGGGAMPCHEDWNDSDDVGSEAVLAEEGVFDEREAAEEPPAAPPPLAVVEKSNTKMLSTEEEERKKRLRKVARKLSRQIALEYAGGDEGEASTTQTKKKKKKNKKKCEKKQHKSNKGTKIEGLRISHLDKHALFDAGEDVTETQKVKKDQKHYMMKALFGKVEDRAAQVLLPQVDPIVSRNADQVVHEAIAKLKQSVQRCSNSSGVMTWTGTHGTLGRPNKSGGHAAIPLNKPTTTTTASTSVPVPAKIAPQKQTSTFASVFGSPIKIDTVQSKSSMRRSKTQPAMLSLTMDEDSILFHSGVQTSLEHALIVDSVTDDFVLLESEADKLSKLAAKWLLTKVKQCRSVRGVDDIWGKCLTFAGEIRHHLWDEQEEETMKMLREGEFSFSTESNQKKYDGSLNAFSLLGGFCNPTATGRLSSRALLVALEAQKMKSSHMPSCDVSHLNDRVKEITDQLWQFMKSQANHQCAAPTTEILAEFTKKISSKENFLFRSILKQICTFCRKKNGIGMWTLHADFQ